MSREYHRLLLLFLDGIGLAPDSDDNPFASTRSPAVSRILGGPLTVERMGEGRHWMLAPLDARLGVEGLPQSATGQATLFTGVNAARMMGRHVTGLPGPRVRALVSGESGLLRRARSLGRRVTFANAYSWRYLDLLERGRARPSVTTCLARAAGAKLRTEEDLSSGRALPWDMVGDRFGRGSGAGKTMDARVAGRRLAALAARHELTLFESFLPDLVGHGRIDMKRREVVQRIDDLIAGILDVHDPHRSVLLTSDHGNFEQRSTKRHTTNSVPLLVVGPAAESFKEVESVAEVTPAVLRLLENAPKWASR